MTTTTTMTSSEVAEAAGAGRAAAVELDASAGGGLPRSAAPSRASSSALVGVTKVSRGVQGEGERKGVCPLVAPPPRARR